MGAFPHIRYAAKSDIGRKRTNNEDAFGTFPSSGIFCVADGMGGGDDGEVASAAIISAVERFAKDCSVTGEFAYPIEGIVSGVSNAVNSASSWIAKRTLEKGLKGCGSTFVGICFDASRPNVAIALHAGDSRLYRVRGRSIEQITVDHSAAELIGAKSEKEINPMFRGMILRAVGIQPTVELERTEVSLKAGDRILICSDGLSRMVPDKKLLSIIRAGEDLGTTVEKLIAAANDAGGVDNITVELIGIGELPKPIPICPQTCPNNHSAMYEHRGENNIVAFNVPSTEENFIPSTASDGENESKEEEISIPEVSSEENLVSKRDGKICKGIWGVVRTIAKLRSNIIACLIVCLTVSVLSYFCVHEKEANYEIVVADEVKIHMKEQKTSLQVLETRRKFELEEKSRSAERERTRLEIQKPEKQSELEEKARIDAENRIHEEKKVFLAHKEPVCLEQLRNVEKEKNLKELEQANKLVEKEAAEKARKEKELQEAAEKARKEKELKEAADKARKEKELKEAADKARKEKELQEAAEKARKEKELQEAADKARKEKELKDRKVKEAEEKQARAVDAFKSVMDDGTAGRFCEKIEVLIPDSISPNLRLKLSKTINPKSPRSDVKAFIVSLTKDVQQVSKRLIEYSSLYLDNINVDLEDPTSDRQKLMRMRNDLMTFNEEARVFISMDPSDPDAQMKCIRFIKSVPKWFEY